MGGVGRARERREDRNGKRAEAEGIKGGRRKSAIELREKAEITGDNKRLRRRKNS
jgi:hypothetical protein